MPLLTRANANEEAGSKHPIFSMGSEHLDGGVDGAGGDEDADSRQQRNSYPTEFVPPPADERREQHLRKRMSRHHIAHELFGGFLVQL